MLGTLAALAPKKYVLFYSFATQIIEITKQGDLTETIRAYERLGLLELRAFSCLHQLKKKWHIVKGGKVVN